MKIEQYEIENLKRVILYWDTLSNNTEALDCMTDHCHTEFHDAEAFIEKLEKLVSQLEPQVSNANGGQSEIILKMAKDWEPQSIFFDELTKDQYNTMIALMRAQIEIFADDIGSRLSC